jgi:hypothetical protein
VRRGRGCATPRAARRAAPRSGRACRCHWLADSAGSACCTGRPPPRAAPVPPFSSRRHHGSGAAAVKRCGARAAGRQARAARRPCWPACCPRKGAPPAWPPHAWLRRFAHTRRLSRAAAPRTPHRIARTVHAFRALRRRNT